MNRCEFHSWLDYWLSLIEDDKGQPSTTRLILWGAFILTSFKVYQVPASAVTWELLGGYGALWVIGYVGGKFADAKSSTVVQMDNIEKMNVTTGNKNV